MMPREGKPSRKTKGSQCGTRVKLCSQTLRRAAGIVLEATEGDKLCGNGNTETKVGPREKQKDEADRLGKRSSKRFFAALAYCFSSGRRR